MRVLDLFAGTGSATKAFEDAGHEVIKVELDMENPRGMLRKQEVVKDLARHTITYCQYGDTRMKPTDVWFTIKNWTPRKMCSPGSVCHESSPAGTNAGGTGKLRNAKLRSMIPYELGLELLKTIEGK
jgi:hypothetical protein